MSLLNSEGKYSRFNNLITTVFFFFPFGRGGGGKKVEGFDLPLTLEYSLRSSRGGRSVGSFREQRLVIEAIVCSATQKY